MSITSMRRKVSTTFATFLLAIAATFGFVAFSSAPAHAAEGIDMNLACQYSGGYTSYKGVLMYPSQGALGWRCVDRAGIRPTVGANLWGYCVNVLGYGGAYTDTPSNPYSWYCA